MSQGPPPCPISLNVKARLREQVAGFRQKNTFSMILGENLSQCDPKTSCFNVANIYNMLYDGTKIVEPQVLLLAVKMKQKGGVAYV